MLKRIRSIWSQDLIRPLLHRAFTRLVWGLFFAFFLAFMIKRWGGGDLRSPLLLLWGILCLVGAWLSYLQLDGLRLPRLDQFRTLLDRKRPKRQSGDMIDFVDEEMQSYEALSDEERYLVLFLADLIIAIIFLIAAALL